MGNFKNVFKNLRLQNGYTQDTLAKALKISRTAISMYERGNREPDFETLEIIADFFNVDMDYLLGRSDIRKKVHFDEDGNEYRSVKKNPEPTYEDVELLIARNGKKMSKEQKLKLIQMLSEIE